jgi:mRNA interferase RelE/StbE
MAFQLRISKNAAKDISKLDNLVRKRIHDAVTTKLVVDPIGNSKKLQDFEVSGVRRLRVGNYRVIFFLDKSIIEILKVGHRREIYKE